MDKQHIISAILPSTYQKLLQLMKIWQRSDRNNFAQIFLRHRVHLSGPGEAGGAGEVFVYTHPNSGKFASVLYNGGSRILAQWGQI